jgi:hypothetical protein
LPTIPLIGSYVFERLETLPAELNLDPITQQLFSNYARKVVQLIEDDIRHASQQSQRASSALHALSDQVDLANNRTAAWESIQESRDVTGPTGTVAPVFLQ